MEGLSMDENQQKQQFQEWLPFYVNGRLGDGDRVWMNHYLADHQNAAADLQVETALKETLLTELQEFAPDTGLEAFMRRIRADSSFAASPTFTDSIRQFILRNLNAVSSIFAKPRWAAVAICLLIIQTGVIGLLITNKEGPLYSDQKGLHSIDDMLPYQGPVLKITFKPSATEEQIRLLMVKIQGSILGGPGQLGIYIVKVPKESIEEAQKQVMSSSIVELNSIKIIQKVPIDH